jgi:hypothetical protein
MSLRVLRLCFIQGSFAVKLLDGQIRKCERCAPLHMHSMQGEEGLQDGGGHEYLWERTLERRKVKKKRVNAVPMGTDDREST